MKEIAAGIYVALETDGSNTGFIAVPGGAIVIDLPLLPQTARQWRQQVLDTTGGKILYLVLTDAHPSRLLSASIMEAPIVAGRAAFDQAVAYTEGFWRSTIDGWARRFPQAADDLSDVKIQLPEILFSGDLNLHAGDETVTIQQVDGAAPGSAWIYLAERDVLFTGDTVIVDTHPHMSATPNTEAWLRTLRTLRRKRFEHTIIVPGRGDICDQSSTRVLSDYIALARRRVRSLHTAGHARAEVASIMPEILDQFPIREDQRDLALRRVKAGLDHMYEELKREE
jgi:glyoxylase-like metal-dependent hydrolase (beta-lactamase superfamily II)